MVKPLNINFRKAVFLVSLMFLFSKCENEKHSEIIEIKCPTIKASGESNWVKGWNDKIALSWIEKKDSSNSALMLSILEDDEFSSPKEISSGHDWFVNWADFPEVNAFGNSNLMTHILQKSAQDTYAYDVKLCLSKNHGSTWEKPFKAHSDTTKTEHGFVSKIPLNEDKILVAWLDGRQYGMAKLDSSIKGQMTLRSAIFDSNGRIIEEYLIDNKVCDCCQTDMAMSPVGPMIVYRDRTDNEIRDISFSILKDDGWTTPAPIFNDQWNIAGCPVNGPSIASSNDNTAVAWFGTRNGQTEVKISFFDLEKNNFKEPLIIDNSKPLGRVDLEFVDDKNLLLSWMSSGEDEAKIKMMMLDKNGNKSKIIEVDGSSGSRSVGFPRITSNQTNAYITYTRDDNETSVKVMKIPLSEFNF